jgi:hypothetical protein
MVNGFGGIAGMIAPSAPRRIPIVMLGLKQALRQWPVQAQFCHEPSPIVGSWMALILAKLSIHTVCGPSAICLGKVQW